MTTVSAIALLDPSISECLQTLYCIRAQLRPSLYNLSGVLVHCAVMLCQSAAVLRCAFMCTGYTMLQYRAQKCYLAQDWQAYCKSHAAFALMHSCPHVYVLYHSFTHSFTWQC